MYVQLHVYTTLQKLNSSYKSCVCISSKQTLLCMLRPHCTTDVMLLTFDMLKPTLLAMLQLYQECWALVKFGEVVLLKFYIKKYFLMLYVHVQVEF